MIYYIYVPFFREFCVNCDRALFFNCLDFYCSNWWLFCAWYLQNKHFHYFPTNGIDIKWIYIHTNYLNYNCCRMFVFPLNGIQLNSLLPAYSLVLMTHDNCDKIICIKYNAEQSRTIRLTSMFKWYRGYLTPIYWIFSLTSIGFIALLWPFIWFEWLKIMIMTIDVAKYLFQFHRFGFSISFNGTL